jgi:hypothetical protein
MPEPEKVMVPLHLLLTLMRATIVEDRLIWEHTL